MWTTLQVDVNRSNGVAAATPLTGHPPKNIPNKIDALRKLVKENEAFLRNLDKVKPTFDRAEWKKHTAENKEFGGRIRRFPTGFGSGADAADDAAELRRFARHQVRAVREHLEAQKRERDESELRRLPASPAQASAASLYLEDDGGEEYGDGSEFAAGGAGAGEGGA